MDPSALLISAGSLAVAIAGSAYHLGRRIGRVDTHLVMLAGKVSDLGETIGHLHTRVTVLEHKRRRNPEANHGT